MKTKPEKIIDWELVDNLLMANCHGTEIAPHFNIHVDTFYRKVQEKHGIGFTEYSLQKKAQGDACIRAQQFMKALGKTDLGDNTLLIWLGKNRLGQKEHQEEPVSKEILTKLDDFMNYLGSTQSHRNIDDNKINNAQ